MIKKITALMLVVSIIAFSLVVYFNIAGDRFAQDFLSRYEEAYRNRGINNGQLKTAPLAEKSVKVPIFVYHSVSPYYPSESKYKKKFDVEPIVFEKQMRYLKENGYLVISFDDLINHFSHDSLLPEKSVILTFDDGWQNQYRYAFPLLKKYNYTATFFIFTNAIGHKHFLTWPQIKELVAAGMTVGDHSKSHPYLYKITSKDKLRQEIIESRKILESNLGKPIDIFAYPFGHYNEEIIALLKENGFKAARTDGYQGVFHAQDELFNLKSIDADNDLTKFVEALNKTQ